MPSKLGLILRHGIKRQPCFCPYCGPRAPVRMLQRNKIVLNIMQCQECDLIFRWPMDTIEADTYYHHELASALAPTNHPPTSVEDAELLVLAHK